MNQSQSAAWIALKKAADKYYQSTGSEVVVATKYYPSLALSENYMPQEVKAETACYGHGTLSSQVKDALNPHKKDSSLKGDWPSSGAVNINSKNIYSNSQKENKYPLSSSYRTLRLDVEPPKGKTHASTVNTAQDLKPSAGSQSSGKRRKKKNRDTDGEFELDENLLFGDEEPVESSDDDSSDDSIEEGVGQLPPRRIIAPNNATAYRDQFATSLPVSINLGWGHQNESVSRFRNNQGPHPPTFNQPISGAQSNAQVVQAEQTPHLDTIMASMQALARSVTDDTALIFGERPRPRVFKESSKKRTAH